MHVLKSIFKFYIHSSIHVALSVGAFTVLRLMEMRLELQFNLLAFIFLASVSGYNFVKYAGVAKLHHRGLTKQLRSIQLFSAIAFFLMMYYLFQLKCESVLLVFSLAFINFVYAFPIFKNGRSLRNSSGLKVFVIALVWSSSIVFLPVIEFEIKMNSLVTWQFLQQMLMMIALMIPFEIRDFRFDDQDLKTLPQIFGIWKTKLLGVLLLFLSVLIALLNNEISVFFSSIFSFMLGGLILFAKKNQSTYYASFWVEAVALVSLCIYLLVKSISF